MRTGHFIWSSLEYAIVSQEQTSLRVQQTEGVVTMVPTGDLPWIEPIRPTQKDAFDDEEWSFEVKYDGFRAMLYILPKGAPRFVSRQDKVLRRFSALARSIAHELSVTSAILDGEIIAKDETGRSQFNDLMRQRRTPSYVAFDIVWLNGKDLRALSLRDRREQLVRIMPERSLHIEQSIYIDEEGKRIFELMREHDLEGVVAKRLDAPYRKRTKWYKCINPMYSQFEGREETFKKILYTQKQKAAR